MTAEIYLLDAWRSKGERRAPTQEQIHDAELHLVREQLQRGQANADRHGAEDMKLDRRLEANVTLKGKNKGKPLSRTRRYQLEEEFARERGGLNDALEVCADLEKRIAELEGGTEESPA